MLLEEQFEMQGIENDALCTDLAAKDDELAVAMDAVAVAKKDKTRLEAEGKAAQRKAEGRLTAFQKKLEAHNTKDKVPQRRIRRLKEKLATAMKAQTEAKEEAQKVKVKLQRTTAECEIALSTVEKEKERCKLLEVDVVDLTATLQECTQKADVTCHIRHKEQRGKPMKDTFVRHCRTLLATGASARSVSSLRTCDKTTFLMRWKRRS